MNPIRVLIVDDHTIVAQGLRQLLSTDRRLQVVGHARTLAEAQSFLAKLIPDVILLDLRLPDSQAPETVAAVRQCSGAARIVVLTAFPGSGAVKAQGADAYLDKQTASDVLIDTIFSLFPTYTVPADSPKPMTARELEVARLAAEGMTNREIARQLFVSPNTVKTHLAQVLQKLGFRNRVDLAGNWHTVAQKEVPNSTST